MITNEKISAVQKQLKKGIPEGELKEALLREGFTKEDIRKVFEPKPYDMQSWYLIAAVLLLLIGIYKVMAGGGFLLLILSAGLFVQYLREKDRLKNMAKRQKLSDQAMRDHTSGSDLF